MKRDYIEEIISKRERAKYNERDSILSHRLGALDAVFQHCVEFVDTNGLQSDSYRKQDNEIHRYIPIGVIACVESFFRATVKELIDFGSPFSEKAVNLREMKFDFSVVQAIAGKELTVGDFLSHLLPMKSFEDINSTIGTLTGKDFLDELKIYFFEKDYDENDESRFYQLNELTDEMNKEVAEIYSDVKETFKLRNIFCHEAAESNVVDTQKIYKCYENTKKFLEATDEFIWELIEPNRPTSNLDMKIRADEKLTKLNERMRNLIKEILAIAEEDIENVEEVQKIWEKYRDERTEMVASSWEGGTGQGLVILEEKVFLTESRIEELKEIFKYKKIHFG
jgi:uncharacterized protein YecT (DUF1311 family)